MGGGQSGTLTFFRNQLLTGQHLANSRGGQLKKTPCIMFPRCDHVQNTLKRDINAGRTWNKHDLFDQISLVLNIYPQAIIHQTKITVSLRINKRFCWDLKDEGSDSPRLDDWIWRFFASNNRFACDDNCQLCWLDLFNVHENKMTMLFRGI